VITNLRTLLAALEESDQHVDSINIPIRRLESYEAHGYIGMDEWGWVWAEEAV
jgi:hypothetical protein